MHSAIPGLVGYACAENGFPTKLFFARSEQGLRPGNPLRPRFFCYPGLGSLALLAACSLVPERRGIGLEHQEIAADARRLHSAAAVLGLELNC